MLNEIKEYAQYSFARDIYSDNGSDPPADSRLKFKAFISNSFAGIERAMVIVARHFLFSGGTADIARARLALNLWCGGTAAPEDLTDSELESIKDWLPDYIRSVFLYGKIREWKLFRAGKTDLKTDIPKEITDFVLALESEEERLDSQDMSLLEEYEARLKVYSKEAAGREYEENYKKYIDPIGDSITRLKKARYTLTYTDKEFSLSEQSGLRGNIRMLRNYLNSAFLDDFSPMIDGISITDPINELCEKRDAIKDRLEDMSSEMTAEEYNAVCNKYNRYISPILNTVNSLDQLSGKRKQYGHAMFSKTLSEYEANTSNNDFKTITYDGILAKAFNAGPLKRFYLCCDDPSVLNIAPGEKERDLLLKTVAAWLLARRSSRGKRYAAVNKTDVTNWLVNVAKPADYKPETLKDESGHILFRWQSMKNITKLSAGQQGEALKDTFSVHFSIAEDSGLDEWIGKNPNGIYFSDNGSGSYLMENVRYGIGT